MTGPAPLSATQQQELAAVVAERQVRTRARHARLVRDHAALVDATHDSPDDEHDPEGATIGFERAQTATLLAGAEAQLAALDRVAADLADGWTGACEACGGPIGFDRLLARPTTRRCMACAASAV